MYEFFVFVRGLKKYDSILGYLQLSQSKKIKVWYYYVNYYFNYLMNRLFMYQMYSGILI